MTAVPLALIVEDHPSDARLVREALRFCGSRYDAVNVTTPAQAIQWLSGVSADDLRRVVVFTDLELGPSSGLFLIRMLRTHHSWQQIPIVVVSGTNDPRHAQIARRYGAMAFVPKQTEFMEFAGQLLHLEPSWLSCLQGGSASAVSR